MKFFFETMLFSLPDRTGPLLHCLGLDRQISVIATLVPRWAGQNMISPDIPMKLKQSDSTGLVVLPHGMKLNIDFSIH